jgi:hypothetical protein
MTIAIIETVPPPGSTDAIARGCICPVDDNNYGEGAYKVDGKTMFWVYSDCQLHSPDGEPGCLLKRMFVS